MHRHVLRGIQLQYHENGAFIACIAPENFLCENRRSADGYRLHAAAYNVFIFYSFNFYQAHSFQLYKNIDFVHHFDDSADGYMPARRACFESYEGQRQLVSRLCYSASCVQSV